MTCGTGSIEKSRQCTGGNPGELGCEGDLTESKSCNPQNCPEWSEWTSWTECSATCGTGLTKKSRECINGKQGELGCEGDLTESKSCNSQDCPKWGEWNSWTECSVTCGTGLTKKSRECINGKPGELGCEGDLTESKSCNPQDCPKWSEWTSWSECSATCGTGSTAISRECIGGKPGDLGCEGDLTVSKSCNSQECSRWSVWSDWSECSASCGLGKAEQSRDCIGGKPAEPGCEGEFIKSKECHEKDCGNWGDWSAWGSCDAFCGKGKRLSTRQCKNGSAGGPGCQGISEDSQPCEITKTPYKCPDNEKMAFWFTKAIDRNIADYKTFGGQYGDIHVPSKIETSKNDNDQNNFWHSRYNSGDRGFEVTFKESRLVTSFSFLTRQAYKETDYLAVSLSVDGVEVARTPASGFTAPLYLGLDFKYSLQSHVVRPCSYKNF